MSLNKYSRFESNPHTSTTILTAAIVGFRHCGEIYACHVILESGAEVFLNGISANEAQAIFDKDTTNLPTKGSE